MESRRDRATTRHVLIDSDRFNTYRKLVTYSSEKLRHFKAQASAGPALFLIGEIWVAHLHQLDTYRQAEFAKAREQRIDATDILPFTISIPHLASEIWILFKCKMLSNTYMTACSAISHLVL